MESLEEAEPQKIGDLKIPSLFETISIACGFKIGNVLYNNLFGYL